MTDGSYQVLARKWRPQKFDQVVGQPAIVRTLSNALEQGRVAHAYCFSGIRGVGKTTIARLLSKGLNCRNAELPTASPCGDCEACVEIEESRNLDVIEMDAASQTGVDDIRQLNEFARYTPSRDRYRVFIIDEAHMLSASAFNALLKTLEEPPSHVVFMLATTEPHKILPTVLSRCQHYPLGRISQAEITSRLREMVDAEQVNLSDDGLSMVAIAADGSLRDAQSLLDKLIAFGGDDVDDETVVNLLGMVDRELLFAATDLLTEQDLAGVLGLVNRMVEQGVDLHQFTLDLLGHLRALLVVATVPDAGEILHLPEGDLERLKGQAGQFEIDDLDRAFALLSASEYRIKQSEVPRYELEMVLSRLARMPRLEPIATLISQLRSGPGGDTGAGPGRPGSSGDAGTSRRSGSGGAGTAPHRAPASAPSTSAPPSVSSAAPAGAAMRTESTTDAPPAAAASVSQPPAPAIAESSSTKPTPAAGGELGLIVDRIRADKPLIAQIVERADTAELRDETLFLTFREAGGIFRARLRDRAALAAIEDAAESALGRKIKVVAGFDGDAEESTGSTPEAESPQPAEVSPAPEESAQQHRDELWRRAEGEPLVQQFVDALRGNLTDVEDT
jgi:DNA polymerase-3 subunit gamma/tau